MKKFSTILLLVVLVLALSVISFAEGAKYSLKPSFDNIVGFDFPSYGWSIKNAQNEIVGFKGFNIGIGYSQKNYFQPYEFNKFNTFWGWGTVGVIIPYLTIGGDYPLPLENGNAINVSAGLVWLAPYVGLSYCW